MNSPSLCLPLVFLSFAFAACSREERTSDHADSKPPEPETKSETPRLLGKLPDFELLDHSGYPFNRDTVIGKVWVANFIFTRCGSTCPMQTEKMQGLQETLKQSADWDDVRLVSFTVDPEYDSARVLADYGLKYEADADRWKFVTGRRLDLWNLSKQGFKLDVGEETKTAAMPIYHSPRMVLLDRTGQIRGYYDGLEPEGIRQLQVDAAKILKEPYTPKSYKKHHYPRGVDKLRWLSKRALAQAEARANDDVFHDFRFTDTVETSGVTFKNVSVEDANKVQVAGHYDHGNGIAVADVDSDGLLDVYWTTQIGSNQLWRNLGKGKFENITTPALTLADRICVAASFADTDNDGDADLFVTSVRGGNAFFINDGNGHFEEATVASGLGYVGHSSGSVFFDYDRDGLLDLFVSNVGVYTQKDARGPGGYFKVVTDAFAGHLKPEERNEKSLLYRNEGGNRFQDVSDATGLVDYSWSGDASPVDANNDGWIDLYVLNMQGHDEFYENVGGKSFQKRSRELFPKTSWGSMGVKFFDYNNDGKLDLYITDMHSDMSGLIKFGEEQLKSKVKWPESFLRSGGQSIYGNTFFRNQADGYLEISEQTLTENYWPWGLSTGDLNADGFEDAFVTCSMNYPFAYAANKALLNDRGQRFLESEFVLGVEPRRGGRTAAPNFTLDPTGNDKDHPIVALENLTEPVEIWGALGSRSSAILDIDNDGDLDILTNEFHDGPMILTSDLTEKRPEMTWLKVNLVGKASNRSGLGARVQVFVGTQVYTKVRDGKSGYLSQSDLPLYFGLDAASAVDRISVLWPSGEEQSVDGPIKPNQALKVSEL